MSDYKSTNKLHGYFAGIFCLISFSAMAGEITFSDATSLQENDRYVVVLGSKPTDTTPSYIKQIQYDRIDINSIEVVTARSEGIHIDVAELQMGNNAELINKVYQAYELGLAMLYFDAHYDIQLTNYRNVFLSEYFNDSPFSTNRIKAIFNNNPSNTIPTRTLLNDSPMRTSKQMSAQDSRGDPCAGRGLLIAGQVMSLMSAFAPLKFGFTVPIDGLAAVFNAGRLVACNEVDNKFTREEIKLIAREAVSDFAIDQMMNALKNLGYSLGRDLNQIKQTAPTQNKEKWIIDRLKESRALYTTLEALGYIASEITAEVAAIEIGLLKQLYHIHEGSDLATQTRIKNMIASKTGRPVTLLRNQFDTFETQEGASRYGRKTYLDSLIASVHQHGWWCDNDITNPPPPPPPPPMGMEPSVNRGCSGITQPAWRVEWGDCHSTNKICSERKGFHDREDADRYGAEMLGYLRDRYQMPRVSRVISEYSRYFHDTVQAIPAGTYPTLKDLLAKNEYTGFRLEDHVSFFQHHDQKGYELSLGVGSYNISQLYWKGFLDDDLSSISVPPGLVVNVHRNNSYTYEHQRYASDGNFVGRFDNAVSSIVILKEDAVTVYSNHNENVRHDEYGTFTDGYDVRLPVGEFTLADLESRGIKNNDIASLHIPAGFTVTLYEHDHYNGRRKVFSASTNLWSSSLNTTSSIKIEQVNPRDEFVHVRSLNGYGNYCLDAFSDTAHLAGGKVGIWPCDANSDAQKWKYDSQGRFVNKIAGTCMVIPTKQQTKLGAPVVVSSCSNSENQKWTLGHTGHNVVHNAGLCLDIPDNGPNAAGKQVEVYTCHDRSNQGWYFDDFKPGDEFVHISSLNGDGDYCLDADSSTAHLAGGKVGIWPCAADSDAQKWKYDSQGRFVNKIAGTCMVVPTNQQTKLGAPVVVSSCSNSENQKWTIGHSRNIVHNKRLCLDIPNNGPNEAGKQVEVYTCHDRSNQGWYFNTFR